MLYGRSDFVALKIEKEEISNRLQLTQILTAILQYLCCPQLLQTYPR